MAEYIDDSGDSFIDIDDFDSEDKGADLNCPEDDDSDPTTKVGFICSENCASALFGYLIFTPPMHYFLICIVF